MISYQLAHYRRKHPEALDIRDPRVKEKISKGLKEYYKTHPHARKGAKHTEEAKQAIAEKNKVNFQGNNHIEMHFDRIHAEVTELEEKGYRVIPITRIIPDMIAIKDGKVFAVEVDYNRPDHDKYTRGSSLFDGVIRIDKTK